MKKSLQRFLVFASLIVLIFPTLVACGGPQTVDAELTEDYQINLSTTTMKAGEITFNIQNTASDLEHEFVVVDTDLAPADMPLNADGDVDEDQITVVDEQEAIQAGESATLTVTLDPGHYVIMCNLPGHFAQGMHIEITVE
jgi:uncharacterized cupredoxin-like copper-binding protein